MLNFLAPAALGGLLLLAIPIAVHLFKPRKMRQTPFSSLRWLRTSQQRLSRRIRWHQMLLFLLRAAFIIFLVLALAKPLLGPSTASKHTDSFVVLDVSRSMAYQRPGQPTPLERARQIAGDLLSNGRVGDRVSLLVTDSHTRIVMPLTPDFRAHLPALESIRATASDTNLSSALTVIRPMLAHCRPNTEVEVFFLTDNHQQSWIQREVAAFTRDLSVPVRIQLVDVGVREAPNGWIADARFISRTEGSTVRRVIQADLGCAGEQAQERTLRLAGIAGVAEQERSVTMEPGRRTVVYFAVPATLNLRGQVAQLELLPADGLPSDDRFFLNLDQTAALRILLVESDGNGDDWLRSGLFLQRAIETLVASPDRVLELVRRTATGATPRDFVEADVIFLAGVPELADAQVESLEDRVRQGAGLVVFLGPTVRPEFYNTKLYKPLQPSDGLLSTALKAIEPSQKESTAPLTGVRWNHRLLAPLSDPKLGDLAQVRFRNYYRFASGPAETDTVLAWIDDEVPALVERSIGAGKVLLFNTTANEEWTDLSRRGSFVPLVDRLLTYLSGGGVRRSFESGETVTLPLADVQPGETVTVHTPNGDTVTPKVNRVGGRTFFRLEAVVEPGTYRVERSAVAGKDFIFVVNVGRGDCILAPTDVQTLGKWFEPAVLEVVDPNAEAPRLAAGPSELALWPWLIGLAGMLLLAETFLVHWLCPRVNPALATVVVHRRGLLRSSPGSRPQNS